MTSIAIYKDSTELTFWSKAPMVAGPSVRRKTLWLVEEPRSMEMSRRKNEATPS